MTDVIRTAEKVAHWSGAYIPAQSCGTCKHGYPNDSAVGVRLGCWRGHVRFDSFTLPHRIECGGEGWEARA